MDEIASSSKFQYNMTVTVNKRVNDISQVVQTNSDAVEQSVFTSKALSNQAAILNELINRFRIK